MATTTNFGWSTPDDTDLVKDGALAIRTLGSAIDTSLVDLKGGTTGQVLSKTSNTDMDFTWVTSDDADAIQNSIVDAKGDLIAASADNTPARLAVGSNGDTLVADSAASTGLRYTAGVGLTQPFINGAFDVWQRGTSIVPTASASSYTADRWVGYRSSGATVSRQATGDTTNLPFIQYCARVQRNSGNTSTERNYLVTSIETAMSIPYAGKPITLSFYARAGANYSAASSALTYRLAQGTGTDQTLVNGFTGESNIASGTVTLTTTWQRFSITGTVASTTTQLGLTTDFTPVGTAGAADYYEITGVQIDVGNVALPFRRSGGTIQGELAACQRYYWRQSGENYNAYGSGISRSATVAAIYVPFPVPMRIKPSSVEYSTLQITDLDSYSLAVSALTLATDEWGTQMARVNVTNGTGATSYRPAFLRNANSGAGYLGFSAEL